MIASEFVPYYLLGLPGQFNWTNAVFNLGSAPGAEQRDPRTTEDCLFLDVIVPESVFKSSNASAPVLVWVSLCSISQTYCFVLAKTKF